MRYWKCWGGTLKYDEELIAKYVGRRGGECEGGGRRGGGGGGAVIRLEEIGRGQVIMNSVENRPRTRRGWVLCFYQFENYDFHPPFASRFKVPARCHT